MPLKSRIEEQPALNLTPMIDVVFLLIIFFMVGTKFYEMEREFDVQVPEVSQARPLTNPPEEIVVNVQDDGRVMVRGERLTLEQLTERLAEAHRQYQQQSVLVRGDSRAAYQYVADVLAACTAAGINHLNLGVKQKPTTVP